MTGGLPGGVRLHRWPAPFLGLRVLHYLSTVPLARQDSWITCVPRGFLPAPPPGKIRSHSARQSGVSSAGLLVPGHKEPEDGSCSNSDSQFQGTPALSPGVRVHTSSNTHNPQGHNFEQKKERRQNTCSVIPMLHEAQNQFIIYSMYTNNIYVIYIYIIHYKKIFGNVNVYNKIR